MSAPSELQRLNGDEGIDESEWYGFMEFLVTTKPLPGIFLDETKAAIRALITHWEDFTVNDQRWNDVLPSVFFSPLLDEKEDYFSAELIISEWWHGERCWEWWKGEVNQDGRIKITILVDDEVIPLKLFESLLFRLGATDVDRRV